MMSQISRDFHFNGSTTSDNTGEFHGSSNHHDGVVQRSFSFFNELIGSSSQNDSGGLGLGTLGESVETLSTQLDFLENSAGSQIGSF
jgi:hypothetical protein